MVSSVWRGYITFGLVSIPVRLVKAARAERVKMREVYTVPAQNSHQPEVPLSQIADSAPASRLGPVLASPRTAELEVAGQPTVLAPVRRISINDEGKQIPRSEVGKGYEVEKGRFIPFDREELKALIPKTSTNMELVEFVHLGAVDPIYFETSYYVQPETAGEKPYALLYAALKDTALVGLAQIAMHRREHVVLVRSGKSGLIAHTMYFRSEVRADQEYKTDGALVNPKELELAKTLVGAMSGEFTPEKFRDTYRENVEKLIAAKLAGQPVAPAYTPSAGKPAINILDALQKSLAGIKKPASSAPAQPDKRHQKKA